MHREPLRITIHQLFPPTPLAKSSRPPTPPPSSSKPKQKPNQGRKKPTTERIPYLVARDIHHGADGGIAQRLDGILHARLDELQRLVLVLDGERGLGVAAALGDVGEGEAEDDGDGRGVVHGDARVQPADAVEVGAGDHLVHDGGHHPREVVQERLRRRAAVEGEGGEGVDLGAGDGGPGVGDVAVGGGGGGGGDGGEGEGVGVGVGGVGRVEGEFVFDGVGGGRGGVAEGGFCGVDVGGRFPAFRAVGYDTGGRRLAFHLGSGSVSRLDVGTPRRRAGLHTRALARGTLCFQAHLRRGRLPRLFLLRGPRRGFPPRAGLLAAALLEALAAAVLPHHVFPHSLPRLLRVLVDDELELGLEGCGGGAGGHGLEGRGGGGEGGGGGGVTAVPAFG